MIKRKLIAKARDEFEKLDIAKLMLREAITKQTPLIFTIKGVIETQRAREKMDYKLRTIEELYKHPFALVNVGYDTIYLVLEDSFPENKQLTKRLETLIANNYRGNDGLLYIIDVDVASEECKREKQINDIAFEALTALEAMAQKLQPKSRVVM